MVSDGIEPTPEQLAEAKARQEAFAENLLLNAMQVVYEGLQQHKKKHGFDNIDQAMVGHALAAYTNYLATNKLLRVSPQSQALTQMGINVIPRAAVEAKKHAEEKRIITLS